MVSSSQSGEPPLAPTDGIISKSDRSVITKFLSKIPIFGPSIELIFDLSGSGRRNALFLLVAFIVYPLVVFYSALIVIRLCPSGVQSAARSFVLSSLGIDEEVQGTLRSLVRSVNENNEYIDFTRTLIFQTPSRSEYYEDIRYGQTVKVKSVAYYPGKASRDAICLVTQDLPSTRVGTLFINVAGTDINEPREIPSRPGERQEITPSLGQDFWKRVKQRLGRSTNDITLRFNFVPNSEIIASPFGKCNDINVVLSMTVFKPQLQR